MNKQKSTAWISFRVKPVEYLRIRQLSSQSAHRKLSEYARKVLLQQPVVIRTRNESSDALLVEMLQVKKELNAIGNNYNQAIRKLHTLQHCTDVIAWLKRHELLHEAFLQTTRNTFYKMNEIHRQWSSE